MTDKRYIHLASDEEWERINTSGITVGEFKKQYMQPDWCEYPGALDGMMGCWSLMHIAGNERAIHKIEDCGDCECRKGSESWKKVQATIVEAGTLDE